jgi:DNA-binding response OmpR family regulator
MLSTPMPEKDIDVILISMPRTSTPVAGALLVSRDAWTSKQIAEAMKGLAISTEICPDVDGACRALHTRKFDAVAVDFALGNRAPEVLGELRLSSSNRTAPTMAITRSNADLALAYCAGTSFVLERPLSPVSLVRTLKAGYGLIVRERRRYFRCPVRTPVLMRRIDMRETRCRMVNISEGGLAIALAPAKLVLGTQVRVEFSLPGRLERFTAVCKTCWRDRKSRVGLRFLFLPLDQRRDLQEWLATRLEESLPESAAASFRDATDRLRSGLPTCGSPLFASQSS